MTATLCPTPGERLFPVLPQELDLKVLTVWCEIITHTSQGKEEKVSDLGSTTGRPSAGIWLGTEDILGSCHSSAHDEETPFVMNRACVPCYTGPHGLGPKIHILTPQPLEPHNGILLGYKVFKEAVKAT